MKYFTIMAVIAAFTLSSCEEDLNQLQKETGSESFMPLHIGNYWRMNDLSYTEVQDTVRIGGELYYKLFSLVGGDAVMEEYLRIDANENLISSSPEHPDRQYIKAKFNANVADTFQTLGDETVNDYKVTVVEKTDSKMTFSFDMIYHPNFKGRPHTVTYLKGLGLDDSWKEIRINGKVFQR